MEHSGKGKACIICGRDKDDKCRWNSEIILCYSGDDFAPSSRFRLGDTVRTGGNEWALVNTSSGFAGASYLFIRHRPNTPFTSLTIKEREKRIHRAARIDTRFLIAFAEIRKLYHFCLSAHAIEYMKAEEIRKVKLASQKLAVRIKGLKRFLFNNRREVANHKKYGVALKIWEKQVRYELEAIQRFERLYLGTGKTISQAE
jgi:hypothetical protein